MSTPSAFVLQAGEGEPLRGPAGGVAVIKAHTASTAGTMTSLEITIGPMDGPPLHSHQREDEMWFIIEGDFRFMAGTEMLHAPKGSYVFVPRNTAHCFQNLGDTPGKVLVTFTPSGMERFFEEHALLPEGPVDEERYRQIARQCWMELLGPPLAVSHPLER